MGIFYKISLYGPGKGSTRGFWLLDTKQYRNPIPLSFSNSFLARSSAGAPCGQWYYQYQKRSPSVSFSVKLLIVNYIRRIQIFIRKKTSEHLFHLSFLFQVIIKFTQTIFHYFIPMLVKIRLMLPHSVPYGKRSRFPVGSQKYDLLFSPFFQSVPGSYYTT